MLSRALHGQGSKHRGIENQAAPGHVIRAMESTVNHYVFNRRTDALIILKLVSSVREFEFPSSLQFVIGK